MRIMERLIQKVDRAHWAKKVAIEKRYELVEDRLGFRRRRYRAFIGAQDTMRASSSATGAVCRPISLPSRNR